MAHAQEVRKLVIGAILATDMSVHFALTADFCRHPAEWSAECLEDRLLMVKTVVHAADLANPARPFPINCYMSTAIHAEFRCCGLKDTRLWSCVWITLRLVAGVQLLLMPPNHSKSAIMHAVFRPSCGAQLWVLP